MARKEFNPERYVSARTAYRFVVGALVVTIGLMARSVWSGNYRELVFFLGFVCFLFWLTRNRWALQMRIGDPWAFRLDLVEDAPMFIAGIVFMAWATFFW